MENKNQEGKQEAEQEAIQRIVVEHIHKGELKSSIEIGTAAKGGAVKIYFDPSQPLDQLKYLVDNSESLKQYLARRMEGAPAEGKKVSQ